MVGVQGSHVWIKTTLFLPCPSSSTVEQVRRMPHVTQVGDRTHPAPRGMCPLLWFSYGSAPPSISRNQARDTPPLLLLPLWRKEAVWTLTQNPLEKRLSPLTSLHKPAANIQTLSLGPSTACSWSPDATSMDQQLLVPFPACFSELRLWVPHSLPSLLTL